MPSVTVLWSLAKNEGAVDGERLAGEIKERYASLFPESLVPHV
jgi:hypothetical protein